jgi:hypothetical protein
VTPTVELYWYDRSTGTFVPEQEEPSPVVEYFYWSEPTQQFVYY